MNIYMIGDTHFGDRELIASKRSFFANADVHDDTIMHNILSVCGPRDALYLMGDIMAHTDKLPLLKTLCERIGTVYVVMGNHDGRRWNSPDTTPTARDFLNAGVAELYGMTSYKGMWLTHAPLHPEERHGRLNIHGHLHGKFTYDDRYLNVSCDALGFMPLDINAWMQAQGL